MLTHTGISRTVLVAGHDGSVRDRFVAALDGAGHRAVAVATGDALLAHLAPGAAPVDLLLLDLRLPRPTGADLVQAVRPIARALPIVVFSGSVTGAAEVRTLAALGIAGYVNEHSTAQQILPALAPHLFPDRFNRRGSPRVTLGAAVACRAGDAVVAGIAFDISRGGMGLRTATVVDAGTAVRLRFRLPGGDTDLEVDARVAWADQRTGMGVQFTRLDPAARRAVDAFVDAHAGGADA
ncbi:MAG TPA: PilZ domain-containing protein [Vicinamibacterales bacterium]|nr:PilZ domain-containing protein [Vicinamibacterales bacterium]